MRTGPLLVLLLAAGCVHTSPTVAVTKRDPAFELPLLARERVAVWPVAAAKVDPLAARGVTDQYGSEEAFLDSLGRTMSGKLVRPGGSPSLRSDQVVAQLGAADATRSLLDSRRLLGTGADSRFAAPPPELASLRSLRALDGIRYALLFPDVSLDLEQTVASAPHMGASTLSWARGRLHLAVVDLGRGSVVWEGDLFASGELTGSGMKQIEDGLATALAEGMRVASEGGLRARLGPCRTNADCASGVCISAACR